MFEEFMSETVMIPRWSVWCLNPAPTSGIRLTTFFIQKLLVEMLDMVQLNRIAYVRLMPYASWTPVFSVIRLKEYLANSLWFEGVGKAPPKKPGNQKIMAAGNSPLLTHLAKFNNLSTTVSLQSLPTGADSIADVIAVELSVINAIQSRSESDWFAAVGQVDALLADAEVLIKQGKFISIKLYPLNDAVYSYERLAAYKFWKKVRSLNELSAA